MESTTCSHLPTWGSWGCWWSSCRGKHWLWWRAKWANWSTTKLQVKHLNLLLITLFLSIHTNLTSYLMNVQRLSDSKPHQAVLIFLIDIFILMFPGKLTDAFSSLARKSHFRALSKKLNLVNIHHLYWVWSRISVWMPRWKCFMRYHILCKGAKVRWRIRPACPTRHGVHLQRCLRASELQTHRAGE